VQILHPFSGSIQEYSEEVAGPDRHRPDHCPQCEAPDPLTAHGFYRRTLVEIDFDGTIRVRRYLCHACKRTVSLLPDFALPYLRFGISVISRFLVARLLKGERLEASATAAGQAHMPYQRGQFWLRRFRHQAETLCLALAALICTPPAASFLSRALQMLQSLGWVRSHRFLFSHLRVHLLGWPRFLAPHGRGATLRPASAPSGSPTHSICLASRPLPA
jgi:transposase-like protein